MITGGKIIGHGTHGKIYEVDNDSSMVKKEFDNRPSPNMCLCPKIKTNCESMCDNIQYEYLLQVYIQRELSKTKLNIKIPLATNFIYDDRKCSYQMEYIHKPYIDSKEYNHLIQIDMFNSLQDELTYGVGHFIGYKKLNLINCNISSPEELAFQIGMLFSYLHFVLNIDGYDCELVLGRNILYEHNQIYLIDFDKVSCFEFQLGYEVIRKIDETAQKLIKFTNINKIARFLYSSMNSMSLLPHDDFRYKFIDGYNMYCVESGIEKDVFNSIIELIEDKVKSIELESQGDDSALLMNTS